MRKVNQIDNDRWLRIDLTVRRRVGNKCMAILLQFWSNQRRGKKEKERKRGPPVLVFTLWRAAVSSGQIFEPFIFISNVLPPPPPSPPSLPLHLIWNSPLLLFFSFLFHSFCRFPELRVRNAISIALFMIFNSIFQFQFWIFSFFYSYFFFVGLDWWQRVCKRASSSSANYI